MSKGKPELKYIIISGRSNSNQEIHWLEAKMKEIYPKMLQKKLEKENLKHQYYKIYYKFMATI